MLIADCPRHDFYYSAISIGWTWGYGNALAKGNIVEFNHIHNIGVKSDGDGPILSDMGGIYTLGKQPGMIIRSNIFHTLLDFVMAAGASTLTRVARKLWQKTILSIVPRMAVSISTMGERTSFGTTYLRLDETRRSR